MIRSDLLHVLTALEDAEEEFSELVLEKEWYVTAVTDKIESSIQIIKQELENARYSRVAVHRPPIGSGINE